MEIHGYEMKKILIMESRGKITGKIMEEIVIMEIQRKVMKEKIVIMHG